MPLPRAAASVLSPLPTNIARKPADRAAGGNGKVHAGTRRAGASTATSASAQEPLSPSPSPSSSKTRSPPRLAKQTQRRVHAAGSKAKGKGKMPAAAAVVRAGAPALGPAHTATAGGRLSPVAMGKRKASAAAAAAIAAALADASDAEDGDAAAPRAGHSSSTGADDRSYAEEDGTLDEDEDEEEEEDDYEDGDAEQAAGPSSAPMLPPSSASQNDARAGVKRKKSGHALGGGRHAAASSSAGHASGASTSAASASASASAAASASTSTARPIITRKRLSAEGASAGASASAAARREGRRAARAAPPQHEQSDSSASDAGAEDRDEEDQEAREIRLLNTAPSWELNRLRKRELVGLLVRLGALAPSAAAAGAETHAHKKQALIDAIVQARDTTSAATSPAASAHDDEDADGDGDAAEEEADHEGSRANGARTALRRRRSVRSRKRAGSPAAMDEDDEEAQARAGPSRSASYQLRQRKASGSRAAAASSSGDEDEQQGGGGSASTTSGAEDGGAEETDAPGTIQRTAAAAGRRNGAPANARTYGGRKALLRREREREREGTAAARAFKAAATLRGAAASAAAAAAPSPSAMHNARTGGRKPHLGASAARTASPYGLHAGAGHSGKGKRHQQLRAGAAGGAGTGSGAHSHAFARKGVAFAVPSPIRTRARRAARPSAAGGSSLRNSTASLVGGSAHARERSDDRMWDTEDEEEEEKEVDTSLEHGSSQSSPSRSASPRSARTRSRRAGTADEDQLMQATPPSRPRRAKLNATSAILETLRHDSPEPLQSPTGSSGSRRAVRARRGAAAKADESSDDDDDDDSDGDDSGDAGDEASSVICSQRRAFGLRPRTRSAHLSRRSTSSLSSQPESDTAPARGSQADDADGDEGVAAAPHKIRRLRNGKLRLPSSSFSEPPSEAPPAEDSDGDGSDSSMPEVGDTTFKPESDVEMADASRDSHAASDAEEDGALGEQGESDDDPMANPTAASLSRLLKAQLQQMCADRGLQVDADCKKADLVQALMQSVDAREGIASSSSAASRSTARNSDSSSHSKGTPTPLLLRSEEKDVQDTQPPTPALTSTNEDAQAVDELNGLDLESLNLVDKEIAPNKLEKLEKIGSGGFKDVYVGKYKVSKSRSMRVAIADIRDQLTEMDIKELSLLRDLKHENIVRFIGVSIPDDPRSVPCMIVSELCSNGDLFDYIRNVPPPSDTEIYRMLLEIARGLEYLHLRKPAIIHRDVKSTNVLVTRNRTVKINDFGLARVKNTTRSVIRSLVGTVNWQAVELWVPKPHYNEKVDIWSAAMTFWEVLQWHQPEKRYPFQGMNEHQIYQDVGQKRQRPYTGGMRRQFGGEIVDLLDRMWDQNPKERPSMGQVCESLEELIELKRAAAKA